MSATASLSIIIWELLPGNRLGHTCICTSPQEVCKTWLNTVMSFGEVAWNAGEVWNVAKDFLTSDQVAIIQPVELGRGPDNPAVLMMKLGVPAKQVGPGA